MPLNAGSRIGGYEIVAAIGAGGMGEVYRARDTRLAREVAIKILAPHIAADRDAVIRFEREARALAALNHPNIAVIYDVIESGDQPALVLELVDGGTLADRVATGPIPVNSAIEYAKQIADALDAAHEAGIVHRDLKPGNIKITGDGRVKVLDFGLAKAVAVAAGHSPDADPTHSPTITVHGISQNVILGTAAYMSPEQARGKRVDKRTDIWAFGCVLFEMLTGKRAFKGETTSDVIAAIIERAPDLTALPASTPPHVRRVIERCLEKDPRRRARDIADVRSELEPRDAPAPVARRRVTPLVVSLALVTSAAIALALVPWRWRTAPAPPPAPIEFTFTAPPGYTLANAVAAPSPDGRSLAFNARDERQVASIWIRSLDSGASRRLDGTEGAANPPQWSPDSRSLAFFVAGTWKRLDLDGGLPVTIVSGVPGAIGASWGPGDVLLTSPANRTSLARVPTTGGSLQQVTTLDSENENSHRWPQLLPDGRHFLFTVRSDSPERLGIRLGSLETKEVRPLVNVASPGVYTEPGWLLFITPDRVLMAQRLEPSTWTLQGTPQPLAGPVRYNGPSFQGAFDASLDGRVLTYGSAPKGGATLEWFDRAGQALGRLGPERDYRSVRLSTDGRLAVVELADARVGTRDIWVMDTSTQSLARFTTNPATDWRGVFSPDAKSMAFASDRAGASAVFRAGLANASDQTLLLRVPGRGIFPVDWSADGSQLFAAADDSEGRPRQLLRIPVDGGAAVTITTATSGRLIMPRVSPDGDRVAYTSDDSGIPADLYVSSLRDQSRVRVSVNGASNPVWGPDGKELFFQNPRGELMRAALSGTTMSGTPQALFRPCAPVGRTYTPEPTEWNYDISADGKRFLVICDPPDVLPSEIRVVVNWQTRLK